MEGCVQVVLNYLVLLLFSKRKRDKIKSRRFISSTWIHTQSQHKLYFLFPTVNSLNVQRLKILLSPATVISQLGELSALRYWELSKPFCTLLLTDQRMNLCDPKLVSKPWQAQGQLQMENGASATREGFYASAHGADSTEIPPQQWRSTEIPVCSLDAQVMTSWPSKNQHYWSGWQEAKFRMQNSWAQNTPAATVEGLARHHRVDGHDAEGKNI